jgi:hypothetical protein
MANLRNSVLVAIQETKMNIQNMADKPVENRLKKAMETMQNHWLVTNKDEQFQAAVGAVLVTATDDEKERINAELRTLKALNAAMNGIPVDMGRAIEGLEGNEPIGLTKIWKEVLATPGDPNA